MTDLSPIEKVGNIFVKREDLATFNNINGGKGRVISQFLKEGINQGYTDFVTCGSRDSVQCEMVSFICECYDIKCHLFMPQGKNTSIIESILNNNNTELIRTKVGYTNVIKKWSSDYAQENDYYYIPFALECDTTINVNKMQVQNIPDEVQRIVVPIGSGMNFISILTGLSEQNKKIPVLGIQIGLDPTKNIQKFLKTTDVPYTIIKSELAYDKKPKDYHLGDIELNQTYEAKCLPYLQDNDLLWIIGKEIKE